MRATTGARAMAAMFTASGIVHVVRPRTFAAIMPAWVPRHRDVIIGSGVAELALAAGLLTPATRRVAGWGSIALLAAVYPANLKMASDAFAAGDRPMIAASLARLPLQWPMVRAAHAATRPER